MDKDRFPKGIESVYENQNSLSQADLTMGDFDGLNLQKVNLMATDFRDSILTNADIFLCNCNIANFRFCDLRKTRFGGSNLQGAKFSSANMEGVNFLGMVMDSESDTESSPIYAADCSWADFSGANLRNVNFIGVRLYVSSFYAANLEGAKLTGCRLLEPRAFLGANLTNADLRKTSWGMDNFIPKNLSIDEIWSTTTLNNANFSGAELSKEMYEFIKTSNGIVDDCIIG